MLEICVSNMIDEAADELYNPEIEYSYENNITNKKDNRCEEFLSILEKVVKLQDGLLKDVYELVHDKGYQAFMKKTFVMREDFTGEKVDKQLEKHLRRKRMLYTERYNYEKLVSFCTTPDEKMYTKPILFNDFSLFESDGILSELKLSDRAHIVFKIIEKNIRMLEKGKFYNDSSAVDFRIYKAFDVEEIFELLHAIEEDEKKVVASEDKKLSENYKKLKQLEASSIKECASAMEKINDVYYKNIDNLTLEDVDMIVDLLKLVEVPEDILNFFKRQTTEKIKVRENNKEASKPLTKQVYTQKETKKYYTNDEFKQMKKEVEMYRDKIFEQEEIDLPADEILRIARNYVICFEDYEGAKHFLKYCDYYKKDQKDNPFADYVHLYDRIKYYEKRFDMYLPLADSKECLENMMICSPEDYLLYKEVLKESLTKMRTYMGGRYDYDYEINRMRK